MAAGRVERRDYCYSSKNEHCLYRHDRYDPEFGRRKEHGGGRDSYRDSSRKREEVDDWRYSYSREGKLGSRGNGRDRYGKKIEDWEAGEVSSDSGSDGSIVFEPHRNGSSEVSMPPRKKLRVSPTKWDRKEKEVSGKFLNDLGTNTNEALKSVSHEPVTPLVFPGLPGSDSSSQEWCGSCDQELVQLEEEDVYPERKISASRWADDDEGEILEDGEILNRGQSIPTSGSSASSLTSKLVSPDFGELTSGYACGSESHLSELHKNDGAEVDEDEEGDDMALYGSDSDVELENDYLGSPEATFSQQRSVNMFPGCRSVNEFELLREIGWGTYGVVFQARDKRSGEIVALKKVKIDEKREREGFPMTSLREISILSSLSHPSIVDVKEVVVGDDAGKDSTFLVMEYMENDLKGLMKKMEQPFSQTEVKNLMLQLLEGVGYLHDNWVLHRDLKTANILLNNCGKLKICDFGLSRQYGSPLKPYTPLVVSLYYRSPEILLGAKQYSTAIDMWSLGCIMAELLTKKVLFEGKSEIDQLNQIFGTLGTPSEITCPGFSKLPGAKCNFVSQKRSSLRDIFPPTSFTGSPYLSTAGFDLLERLLTYDPEKRIAAHDAVNHAWFREFPLPNAK